MRGLSLKTKLVTLEMAFRCCWFRFANRPSQNEPSILCSSFLLVSLYQHTPPPPKQKKESIPNSPWNPPSQLPQTNAEPIWASQPRAFAPPTPPSTPHPPTPPLRLPSATPTQDCRRCRAWTWKAGTPQCCGSARVQFGPLGLGRLGGGGGGV